MTQYSEPRPKQSRIEPENWVGTNKALPLEVERAARGIVDIAASKGMDLAETIRQVGRVLGGSVNSADLLELLVASAVRSYGKARIRTRSGETFIITPDPEAKDSKNSTQTPDFESRWNQLWEMGLGEVSSEDQDKYDQIIAGER